MALYIKQDSKGKKLSSKGNVKALINDGASVTTPDFKSNLVCVLDKGRKEIVRYFESDIELAYFIIDGNDNMTKTFLVYPHATTLAH